MAPGRGCSDISPRPDGLASLAVSDGAKENPHRLVPLGALVGLQVVEDLQAGIPI